MDLNEFKSRMKDIAKNLEDQSKVTEILTELEQEAENLYNANTTLKEQHELLEKDNKSLKERNMNLYLQTGQPVEDKALNERGADPLQYEDLIKEME